MLRYILQRSSSLLLTLVAASVVVFAVMEILPGDPALVMLGINAQPDTLAALRSQMGLNEPLLYRYFSWIFGLVQGDFGFSYTYRIPVVQLVAERMVVSLPLALTGIVFSTAIAIPIGVFTASRRGSMADSFVMGGVQLGVAVPNFWLAILFVIFFSVQLRWFSAGGFAGWDEGPLPALKSLLLPALALALPQAAILARVTRSSILETMQADFIRTARAKGLSRSRALYRHALRNALIPIVTIIGLQFSFLLAGTLIIENVFNLPGLGKMIFKAIDQRDLIVLKSVIMLLCASVVVVNFLVDLCYVLLDPRLRRESGHA